MTRHRVLSPDVLHGRETRLPPIDGENGLGKESGDKSPHSKTCEHANDAPSNIRVAERCTLHESLSPSWLLLWPWSPRVAHAAITPIPAAKCPTAIAHPLRFRTGNTAVAPRALRANTWKDTDMVYRPKRTTARSKRRHHPSRQSDKTAVKPNDCDPVCQHLGGKPSVHFGIATRSVSLDDASYTVTVEEWHNSSFNAQPQAPAYFGAGPGQAGACGWALNESFSTGSGIDIVVSEFPY